MSKGFNIFEILSKDDKELSHSALIKFLLEEDAFFSENLIGVTDQIRKVHLESKELGKKFRLDLLIHLDDKVIAIENKFKSLPRKDQLILYAERLREIFPDKGIEKFLLYFEKGSHINIPSDWKCITYHEIFQLTQEYLNNNQDLEVDKEVLIRHYAGALKKYLDKYDELKNPASDALREVFLHPNQGINKFWLHLIFHELASIFDDEGYEIWVGGGSTYMPLMNVHLPEWNFYSSKGKGYELVIQLNGRNLKYYAHLKGLNNKQEIIDEEVNRLKSAGFQSSESGKFKGKIRDKSNTAYIYQEDIIEFINSKKEKVTLESLKRAIEDIILRIKGCR